MGKPWALVVWTPDYPPTYRYYRTRDEAQDAVPPGARKTNSYKGQDAYGRPKMMVDRDCDVYVIVDLSVEPSVERPSLAVLLSRQRAAAREPKRVKRKLPTFPVTTTYRPTLAGAGQLRGPSKKAPPSTKPIPGKSKLAGRGRLRAVCTTNDALAGLNGPAVLAARATPRHGCGVAR